MASSDSPEDTGIPGWDGTAVAAWRLNLAQYTWHQLGVVGPRAQRTGEDRTLTDWVEAYVNMGSVRIHASEFVQMWFTEAQIHEVPRNWLNWAVDLVQSSMRVGTGNPADAQHSAYLLDCDVFLTADVRLVRVLERVRTDAPFTFSAVCLVSGDRSLRTIDRIDSAWA